MLAVSIARRRLVVLRHRVEKVSSFTAEAVSIARRRLVVLRQGPGHLALPLPAGFNRPKAISCLATTKSSSQTRTRHGVSIARRRLVVLRRRARVFSDFCDTVSIARRRLVVLRHTQKARRAKCVICFNRPKAISCLATALVAVVLLSLALFQSPEGD